MKVYEVLKKENLNKKFKDTEGDIWKVVNHMEKNLLLVLANDGSQQVSITNMHYLDEILELNFVEVQK